MIYLVRQSPPMACYYVLEIHRLPQQPKFGFTSPVRSSPPPPPGPDTTPPTVSITAPIAGNTVTGNVLTVSAAASDNIGVVGVQFKLDGNNWGAEVTSSPFSVSWDTTVIANGSHALTAIARDAAGNSTTSTPVTVSVSNSVSSVPLRQQDQISKPDVRSPVFSDASGLIRPRTLAIHNGARTLASIRAVPVCQCSIRPLKRRAIVR